MVAGNARHVTRVRKSRWKRGARFVSPSSSPLSVRGTIKNIADAAVWRYLGRRIDFFRYRGLDRLAGNDVAAVEQAEPGSHLARVAPPSAFSRALAPSFLLPFYLPAPLISCENFKRARERVRAETTAAQLRSRFDEFLRSFSTGGFDRWRRREDTFLGLFRLDYKDYRGLLGLVGRIMDTNRIERRCS